MKGPGPTSGRRGLEEAPSVRRSLFGSTWSIVAPARVDRPQPSVEPRANGSTDSCPFCEHNEGETEPEVLALRTPGSRRDGPGWRVRVVPNRYPALRSGTLPTPFAIAPYEQTAAVGFHEVIVETPVHDRRLACWSVEECETILGVYVARVKSLSAEPGVKSIALFRNEGRDAGASQDHPHAQILAMPVVPERLRRELIAVNQHFHARGRCLTCEILALEEREARYRVSDNEDFCAITSYAPRFPCETWILPKRHASDFGALEAPQLRNLARILKQVFGGLESILGSFPFNLVLQSAPVGADHGVARSFHWRFEVLPRLSAASGFELGSDVFIVSTSPEAAAAKLRTVQAVGDEAARDQRVE
jgi:UDPglucose--hexose-1-phosphate uridylyltransferase